MKRALALLAPAVLALGLVACGDDDDDTPDTTEASVETIDEVTTAATTDVTETAATTSDGDETGAGGSVDADDTLQRIFPNLTDEEISCLGDRVDDLTATQDPAEAQAIAEECGIDPADLDPDMSAISLPDMSGVSVPDNMDEMMQRVFPGLTDEQVSCLVDELGADFDVEKAQQVAETCDIEPADLAPG